MLKVSIIASEYESVARLGAQLAEKGMDCSIPSETDATPEKVITKQAPDLVLVSTNCSTDSLGAKYLAQKAKIKAHPPVIALLSLDTLDNFDPSLPIDDFVIKPWVASEVTARIVRTLRRTRGIDRGRSIERGDLVIDLDNCEVTVAGRLITLTFKEYEVLRLLASNRGRVFTRDRLLDEVWGHDYFGGDRTVDVHIRRLRSKIEDSTHTFIETVRNIGYKFRKDL